MSEEDSATVPLTALTTGDVQEWARTTIAELPLVHQQLEGISGSDLSTMLNEDSLTDDNVVYLDLACAAKLNMLQRNAVYRKLVQLRERGWCRPTRPTEPAKDSKQIRCNECETGSEQSTFDLFELKDSMDLSLSVEQTLRDENKFTFDQLERFMKLFKDAAK